MLNARTRSRAIISATAALHLAACLAVIWHFRLWPWALGVLAVNHLLIAGCGLWPRSTTLGPNLTRLPDAAAARGEIALTIDDGPDSRVTPLVLDMLDAFGAKASFFCIGGAAEANPALCREIMRRGHAIENHTQHHRHHFSLFGPAAIRREISAAQANLTMLGGEAPQFFRAPAGLRNLFLAPVLDGLGLRLVSWTRRGFDTVKRDPALVARLLLKNLRAGDILLLHDGNAARTQAGVPVILEVLPVLLADLRAAGLRSVTLREAMAPDAEPPGISTAGCGRIRGVHTTGISRDA
jgi:peptidoglycan/xylan/chitin deacetylase (PgdA/CDA1 family)